MAKSKEKSKSKEVKLPALDFGQKQSVFTGRRAPSSKFFVPKTFRITQHKGGGK